MAGRPISTWTFVLGLVKWGRHVLLVQTPGDARWSLPGGRVAEGEALQGALARLVREATGLEVEPEGLLKVEYTPIAAGDARARFVFLARPAGETAPKAEPDQHSVSARWFTRGEVATLPLRSPEVQRLLALAFDGPVAPLATLGSEL